jgi:hypothetical protein
MFSLRDYAETWDRPTDTNFAVACFEQNTLDELETAAGQAPDPADLAQWQLDSGQEWQDAIAAALWERMTPRVDAANALIAAYGLADGYGETGGLLAEYIVGQGLILANEAWTERFPSDVTDDTLRAYLQTYKDEQA